MKTLTVLLVSLAFANGVFAQAPAPAGGPILLAQAGGAASGAGVPAASTGAVSTILAVVAIAAAGVAAVATGNSTTTTPASH